ncbi:MAG: F0F1 ATP synthase subunit B [Planctomycetia bacterium]|nr:F0F1 ATP synthase subunit B [Planctomycetia bacterium]
MGTAVMLLLRTNVAALLAAIACIVAVPTVATAAPAAAADAHDAHGDHAHLGHGDANVDPGEIKKDMAIFTAAVFFLLVVILRKFAWGPIASGLEAREHHIAEHITGAERANREAKAMLAEYQKKLEAAHLEVRGILDEARRDAEHTKQEIVAAARAEAAAEMDRGKREVQTAMDQALKHLTETSAEQAVYLAGKVLQQQLKPADHARLIDEAMAKFPKSTAQLN